MFDGKQVKNKANPNGTGKYLDERGQYITVPGASAFQTVEIDLGTSKRSGNFIITSSGLTVGKQVIISQATGPYTGKGTLADESEMDFIGVNGVVVSATQIKCFWNSNTVVKGNFKFNYLINT